jgi:hypothetical protein
MPLPMTWIKSFRDAFCLRYACSPDEFEHRVFWMAIYRRSLPFAALVYAIHRRYFEMDFITIRELGKAQSSREFCSELSSGRSEYRAQLGFLRNTLRLRISGKRLAAILAEVSPDAVGHENTAIESKWPGRSKAIAPA